MLVIQRFTDQALAVAASAHVMSGAVLTFSVLAVVFGYTQQISTPRTAGCARRLSKERSMPDFVPIDDYVTDESFPGFAPSGAHSPWATVAPSRRSDPATTSGSGYSTSTTP